MFWMHSVYSQHASVQNNNSSLCFLVGLVKMKAPIPFLILLHAVVVYCLKVVSKRGSGKSFLQQLLCLPSLLIEDSSKKLLRHSHLFNATATLIDTDIWFPGTYWDFKALFLPESTNKCFSQQQRDGSWWNTELSCLSTSWFLSLQTTNLRCSEWCNMLLLNFAGHLSGIICFIIFCVYSWGIWNIPHDYIMKDNINHVHFSYNA